jgi:AcrR family transcriptional regulator
MRSHGWSGNPPASDEEAIARILSSADRIVAERGSSMRIADVARDLGVTRQTVYRYFPGTEALLVACAMQKADGFLARLERRVRNESDPVTTLVEGMAFTIESLADDPQIVFLLSQRGAHSVGGSFTSDTALTFGRSLLHRLDVDWAAYGFDEPALAELNEFLLRVMNSFLIDVGNPKRNGTELRTFLSRWIGPAIVYPQLAETAGPLIALKSASVASPRRRP